MVYQDGVQKDHIHIQDPHLGYTTPTHVQITHLSYSNTSLRIFFFKGGREDPLYDKQYEV